MKIIGFYIVFYAALTSFFGICCYGFSKTLDAKKPKWILEESLIGTNPGLGFKPKYPPFAESTLIWYRRGDEADMEFWYSQLETFIEGSSFKTEMYVHIQLSYLFLCLIV